MENTVDGSVMRGTGVVLVDVKVLEDDDVEVAGTADDCVTLLLRLLLLP